MDVEVADLLTDGWRHWMVSDRLWSKRLGMPSDEGDMLSLDKGQTLGLTRMVARRNERPIARLDSL